MTDANLGEVARLLLRLTKVCYRSDEVVNPVTSNTIDLVEFVYDLDVERDL